ncbi:MAG: MATE family efflux transporter [Christensenellales bacterium]
MKKLIWPLIIEQLLTVTVGMMDTVMIASVGESAVSAVSLVDSIMILIIQIFAAIATGGAVVAGQFLGAKDEDRACQSANQLICLSAYCPLRSWGCLSLREFITPSGFRKNYRRVMAHSSTYLDIVSLSIPSRFITVGRVVSRWAIPASPCILRC